MQVPTSVLPDNSPFIGWAYQVAISTVNLALTAVPGPIYMLAVYNLGGSNLVNWAQDSDPPVPYSSTIKTPYWQYLRRKFNTLAFVPGVVNATTDESTSESFDTLEQYKRYTLANLQQLKDPWGRTYLGFAADYGELWGLT